jgi:anti-anti-sigma factor
MNALKRPVFSWQKDYHGTGVIILLRSHSAFGEERLEITTAKHGNVTMISVSGRVDSLTAGDLEQAINGKIGQGHRQILLNFADVTYISSGGLRVLLATAKKLRGDGDKYALCSLSAEVHKVLRLTGFLSIFTTYPSEGEAFARW